MMQEEEVVVPLLSALRIAKIVIVVPQLHQFVTPLILVLLVVVSVIRIATIASLSGTMTGWPLYLG
jgi:hypothetical protein